MPPLNGGAQGSRLGFEHPKGLYNIHLCNIWIAYWKMIESYEISKTKIWRWKGLFNLVHNGDKEKNHDKTL